MSYAGFGGRRAALRRRRGSIMTRVAVGLSPLWLGALFLGFENTSGRADKPLQGLASAEAEEVAIAPEPSPAVAMLTADTLPTPGRTSDAASRRSPENRDQADTDESVRADDDRLAQRTPEKLDALPQTGLDEPVAASVPQPTWMPKPRPRDLLRPLPDEDSQTESHDVSAIQSDPENRVPTGRWKVPPEPAVSGGPGQEAPPEKLGAWEDPLATPVSPPLNDARIVIHEPRSGVSTGARDLLSVLRTRGVGVAEIRNVGASVSQPDIRFFHERDRALAEQVDRMLSSQGFRPALKDFTHYQQPPSRGTVEVWLPG